MPESSGSREGQDGGGGSSSRFARLLPPTHIQKVGTRLELEVEARQNDADGGEGGPVSSVNGLGEWHMYYGHTPTSASHSLFRVKVCDTNSRF